MGLHLDSDPYVPDWLDEKITQLLSEPLTIRSSIYLFILMLAYGQRIA